MKFTTWQVSNHNNTNQSGFLTKLKFEALVQIWFFFSIKFFPLVLNQYIDFFATIHVKYPKLLYKSAKRVRLYCKHKPINKKYYFGDLVYYKYGGDAEQMCISTYMLYWQILPDDWWGSFSLRWKGKWFFEPEQSITSSLLSIVLKWEPFTHLNSCLIIYRKQV